MIICGVKITHDSGLALVDDGRLVASVETEKIGNGLRHSRMPDLGVIPDLLAEYGYDLDSVDELVIDGWRDTAKRRLWNDQAVLVGSAPYRRGITSSDLFQRYEFRLLDRPYSSYAHYATHVASAYCTSPFAALAQDAYVLCWDGRMFPFVYHVSPDGSARSLGPIAHLLGDAYRCLAQLVPPFYPPFDGPVEAQEALAIPGKVMAYAGLGSVDDSVVAKLQDTYDRVTAEVFRRSVADVDANERRGRAIIDRMMSSLSFDGANTDDVIASVQYYVGKLLLEQLVKVIDADGRRTPNLCLVGGCALNIKWNRAIRDSGIADTVWVPPFPNDAGSAIGAACCALLTHTTTPYLDWSVYSGPPLPTTEATPLGWTARPCTITELAHVLHNTGQPVVFLHGRAELGPRALGHRSILAPATDPTMKDTLNTIKEREPYRPVAPICLQENAPDVFDPGTPDPYMLFDHTVRPEWRHRIPAICHVDNTARLQTIHHTDEPTVHQLLTTYYQISGIPLLCNTSANHKGRGFFPDPSSAMEWGQIPRVWANSTLYENAGGVHE